MVSSLVDLHVASLHTNSLPCENNCCVAWFYRNVHVAAVCILLSKTCAVNRLWNCETEARRNEEVVEMICMKGLWDSEGTLLKHTFEGNLQILQPIMYYTRLHNCFRNEDSLKLGIAFPNFGQRKLTTRQTVIVTYLHLNFILLFN